MLMHVPDGCFLRLLSEDFMQVVSVAAERRLKVSLTGLFCQYLPHCFGNKKHTHRNTLSLTHTNTNPP